MKVGYARVSTREQNLESQIDALKKAGCTTIHQEVVSGAKTERPVLETVIKGLRKGDVLVIWKLDRLGRTLKHLVTLVNDLLSKQVGIISLNDPIDTTTPQGNFAFNIFASLAEFERDLIIMRKKYYWKNILWTRSYCLITAGGAPLSVLKQYIQNQQTPKK